MDEAEFRKRLGGEETRTDRYTDAIRLFASRFNCRCAAKKFQITSRDQNGIAFGDLPFLPSPSLSRHLALCESVFLTAVTLGHGADRMIGAAGLTDPALHFVLDAFASAAAESLISWFDAYLRGQGAKPSRRSPGYGDFSLSFQTPLLTSLSAGTTLGILLDASDYMTPSKSITAVLGNLSAPESLINTEELSCNL